VCTAELTRIQGENGVLKSKVLELEQTIAETSRKLEEAHSQLAASRAELDRVLRENQGLQTRVQELEQVSKVTLQRVEEEQARRLNAETWVQHSAAKARTPPSQT
jgi:hypothetical protein